MMGCAAMCGLLPFGSTSIAGALPRLTYTPTMIRRFRPQPFVGAVVAGQGEHVAEPECSNERESNSIVEGRVTTSPLNSINLCRRGKVFPLLLLVPPDTKARVEVAPARVDFSAVDCGQDRDIAVGR